MSYLSSPLWLLMIGIALHLPYSRALIRPEIFSHDFQLFPTWPRFDVTLMMALSGSASVLVDTQKLGAHSRAVTEAHSARRRRRHRP